jgi:hypothetical protein
MDRLELLELVLDLLDERLQEELLLVVDLDLVPVRDGVEEVVVALDEQNRLLRPPPPLARLDPEDLALDLQLVLERVDRRDLHVPAVLLLLVLVRLLVRLLNQLQLFVDDVLLEEL